MEEIHARIVLSDKGGATGPHSGAYNPVTNCNELSILTDTSKPAYSDLVVRRRNDGKKQRVRKTNSNAMPLHFVVAFMQGTHGWHHSLKKGNTSKNMSPSEFYDYHMMKRNTLSDYILNA